MIRWILLPLFLLIGGIASGLALLGIVLILAYPKLPAVDALTDFYPKVPLRIYTADGSLIGEFGEERRRFVRIQDVPEEMKQAILAAEDERFYAHPGIDYVGVLRAAYSNLIGGGKRQGASTITMQVARNFFLSTEKTMTRKLYESLLAFKIEKNLSKDEIFQLYVNQIFLGQRAYGFAAAAQIYFGKNLNKLNVAEMAMLAGLPKSPSKINPITNMNRAKQRQRYVLGRMLELHFIDRARYDAALEQPITIRHSINQFQVEADFITEMARQIVVESFPEQAYTTGIKVITTIDRREQEAAINALRQAVLDYELRHTYQGAEAYVDLSGITADNPAQLDELLYDFRDLPQLKAGIVLEASPKKLRVYIATGEVIELADKQLKYVSRMLHSKAPADKRLRRGAIIRLTPQEKAGWKIVHWPEVEAAFIAASPLDGSIRALVGGFDFNHNKFNHVTQAWRQPGSSMKPFVFSAALEKGFTPLSILPDEPLLITAEETGDKEDWEPKNYNDKYEGPLTFRTALTKSKNMAAIGLIRHIDPAYAQDYITRFGFDADKNPPFLTLALGAGSVTPWQQLAAYAVFANGGYRVQPFFIKQIIAADGSILAETRPVLAGDEAQRILDARNAWIMDSILKDVVRSGTAASTSRYLKRRDLAGKTGTTNDYIDAWFCGYQPSLVGIAWLGFDQPKRLGYNETGGHAALPMWASFMREALKDVPEMPREMPAGIMAVESLDPSNSELIRDYVYREAIPEIPPDGEIPFMLDSDSPFLLDADAEDMLAPLAQETVPVVKADPPPLAPVANARVAPVAPDRHVAMPSGAKLVEQPKSQPPKPPAAKPQTAKPKESSSRWGSSNSQDYRRSIILSD